MSSSQDDAFDPDALQTCDCPICFEPMLPGNMSTTTCRHEFHERCLEKVYNGYRAMGDETPCPMCRQVIESEPLCIICLLPLWPDDEQPVTRLKHCEHVFHSSCWAATHSVQVRRNRELPPCGQIVCVHCHLPLGGPSHWCEKLDIERPDGWCAKASISCNPHCAHVLLTSPNGRRGFAHVSIYNSQVWDDGFRGRVNALVDIISHVPLFRVTRYVKEEHQCRSGIQNFILPGPFSNRVDRVLERMLSAERFEQFKDGAAIASLVEATLEPDSQEGLPHHIIESLEGRFIPEMRLANFLVPVQGTEFERLAKEVITGLKEVDPIELGWYPEESHQMRGADLMDEWDVSRESSVG